MIWPNGARAAVSLTFDDARQSQVTRGFAHLDALGINATFYVMIGSMTQHLDAWKRAAASGHEIGNHSMTHPCSGNFGWGTSNVLESLTLEQMASDIDQADVEIHRLLGLRATTFAYPCGQKFVGRGEQTQSYVPLVAKRYKAGRGFNDEAANDSEFVDLAQTLGVDMDCKTLEQLKPRLDDALKRSGWLVLAGHEMSDTPAHQTTRLQTIDDLARFCADNKIWLATVDAVATHILNTRKT